MPIAGSLTPLQDEGLERKEEIVRGSFGRFFKWMVLPAGLCE